MCLRIRSPKKKKDKKIKTVVPCGQYCTLKPQSLKGNVDCNSVLSPYFKSSFRSNVTLIHQYLQNKTCAVFLCVTSYFDLSTVYTCIGTYIQNRQCSPILLSPQLLPHIVTFFKICFLNESITFEETFNFKIFSTSIFLLKRLDVPRPHRNWLNVFVFSKVFDYKVRNSRVCVVNDYTFLLSLLSLVFLIFKSELT